MVYLGLIVLRMSFGLFFALTMVLHTRGLWLSVEAVLASRSGVPRDLTQQPVPAFVPVAEAGL